MADRELCALCTCALMHSPAHLRFGTSGTESGLSYADTWPCSQAASLCPWLNIANAGAGFRNIANAGVKFKNIANAHVNITPKDLSPSCHD